MTPARKVKGARHSGLIFLPRFSSWVVALSAGLSLAVFLFLHYASDPSPSSPSSASILSDVVPTPPADGDGSKKGTVAVSLEEGSFSIQTEEDQMLTVPYNFCGPSKEVSSAKIVWILLHGARFTKEDWKASGIHQSLCDYKNEDVAALALDLPSQRNNKDLKSVLAHLKLTPSSSHVYLVTPSASGKVVQDWLQDETGAKDMAETIYAWIPIAPAANFDYDSLKNYGAMPKIFPVYGSRDSKGKTVSSQLEQLPTSIPKEEIPGGHPCYLDSPTLFVDVTKTFMQKDSILSSS